MQTHFIGRDCTPSGVFCRFESRALAYWMLYWWVWVGLSHMMRRILIQLKKKKKNIRKHSVRDALPLRRGLNFQHIHICFKLLEKKKRLKKKSTVSVEILYNRNVLNVSEWGIPWQASSLHGGKKDIFLQPCVCERVERWCGPSGMSYPSLRCDAHAQRATHTHAH